MPERGQRGLNGKAVIITGGSSGIGRAASLRLAQEGASVTVADINESGGAQTVAEIESAGGRAQFVRTSVAEEADVRNAVARTIAAYGRLDGAINAAAIPARYKTVHELSVADWDRANAVNLRGVFLCLKYQIEAMLGTGGGSIVVISSIAAFLGVTLQPEYCATKAGLSGLMRNAAIDYAGRAIRLNCVQPGPTRTPMSEGVLGGEAGVQAVAKRLPMGRFAEPDEIAAAAVWLLSDDASYVTGIDLIVDGGRRIFLQSGEKLGSSR